MMTAVGRLVMLRTTDKRDASLISYVALSASRRRCWDRAVGGAVTTLSGWRSISSSICRSA